jgi:hypothetical protein
VRQEVLLGCRLELQQQVGAQLGQMLQAVVVLLVVG